MGEIEHANAGSGLLALATSLYLTKWDDSTY